MVAWISLGPKLCQAAACSDMKHIMKQIISVLDCMLVNVHA